MKLIGPLIATAIALASIVLLAGCGTSSSSSDVSSTSTTMPSPEKAGIGPSDGAARAAYVKEADAVCLATDEVTATLDAELTTLMKTETPGAPSGRAKLIELLGRLVLIGREETQEMASIRPPAADDATVEHWIGTGSEGLDDLEAAATMLKKEAPGEFGRLYREGLANLKRARGIARGYGLEVCGSVKEIQIIH